jgi:putative transposase
MLLERGIVVSYETVRRWARKFGRDYARRLKRKRASGSVRNFVFGRA